MLVISEGLVDEIVYEEEEEFNISFEFDSPLPEDVDKNDECGGESAEAGGEKVGAACSFVGEWVEARPCLHHHSIDGYRDAEADRAQCLRLSLIHI